MGLRKKILIVEDNEFNRALLVEILSSQYETLEAENGKVGLEILEREKEAVLFNSSGYRDAGDEWV